MSLGQTEASSFLQADLVTNNNSADVVFLFTEIRQIKEALINLPSNLRSAHFITLQNGLYNGEQVAVLSE